MARQYSGCEVLQQNLWNLICRHNDSRICQCRLFHIHRSQLLRVLQDFIKVNHRWCGVLFQSTWSQHRAGQWIALRIIWVSRVGRDSLQKPDLRPVSIT